MKVTVNEKKKEQEVKYPCLMVHTGVALYVLFSAEETGTVISSVRGRAWGVGEHFAGWDMSVFTPFHGSITLENEE
jgi:hypothetical protein